MAWTSPMTAVAGVALAAANWNAHLRDNLKALLPLDVVAGLTWTPTFTQSGAVSKTVTMAEYQQFGKWVMFSLSLTSTGAGTANNQIIVGLPVTAASANSQTMGSGYFIDASTTTIVTGIAVMASTTTMKLVDSTIAVNQALALGQTGTTFSAAIAASDIISISGIYRAA